MSVQAHGVSPPLWQHFRRLRASPARILAHFGVDKPPIDVEGLAESMGVVIRRFTEPRDFSGALDRRETPPVIWLRATDWEVRQRFTIGHELGHLVLHEERVLWRDTTYLGDPQEIEANQFAAELLMPGHMVRILARSRDEATLARIFHVSPAAMSYRLMNLGLR